MAGESLDYDDSLKFQIVPEDLGRGAVGLCIAVEEPVSQIEDDDLGIDFGTLRIRND